MTLAGSVENGCAYLNHFSLILSLTLAIYYACCILDIGPKSITFVVSIYFELSLEWHVRHGGTCGQSTEISSLDASISDEGENHNFKYQIITNVITKRSHPPEDTSTPLNQRLTYSGSRQAPGVARPPSWYPFRTLRYNIVSEPQHAV